MRKAIGVCALAGVLLATAAWAEHTRIWVQTEYSEFQKGTAKGVAIRSDGKLAPAPEFKLFADPNLSYLWAIAADAQGRVYTAGGSNAKVLRFDDAGKGTTVFESSELAAQAIALDSEGNLYVGTSPDGKVYRVTAKGEKSVYFEPKTKYIWALALDSTGTLFVGTGDTGEVYAVAKNGQGKLFYKTDEQHARSLGFDAKGNLLVGTDPSGLVIRVALQKKTSEAVPEAGGAFVLYETARKEITSLVTDPSGAIYAAAMGEKTRATPASQPPAPATGINITLSTGAQSGAAPQATQSQPQGQAPVIFFPSMTGGSEVYRIGNDDSPEVVWTSRDELVYSLGLNAEGRLLLGTGNQGKVIELDGDNVFMEIADTGTGQVTGFLKGPGGKVFVAGANAGKVFALGREFAKNGTYESQTFDARIFSKWGRLTWWGQGATGKDKVEFYVRSGNTSAPGKNWSEWKGPYGDMAAAEEAAAGCPSARFAQWKVVFLNPTSGATPQVAWVKLAYQPKNIAPVMDGIAIQDPNVRAQGFSGAPAPGTNKTVQLRMPASSGVAPSIQSAQGSQGNEGHSHQKTEAPPQGYETKGYESVLWNAHDDNDDDLVFAIYYRAEGDAEWRLLKKDVAERYYSWDTQAMPDGAYYLKIVASDAPSNPPADALTTEKESERFEVDNTPPSVQELRAAASATGAEVSFTGRASGSTIARAEYSVDAGEWKIIEPVRGLTDAPSEEYRFAAENLTAGEHTVAARVFDRFGNNSTASVNFTISGNGKR
jgi:hypothetical protein